MSETNNLNTSSRFRNLLSRKISLLGIPLAALLIFLSRPLASYIARESCYYMRGPAEFWPNPFSGAWHATRSLYECEFVGNWGFNWLSIAGWIKDKGQSIVTSFAFLGGTYATWKSIIGCFKKNRISEEERSRLRVLAQHLEISRTEGDIPDDILISNQSVRFSSEGPASQEDKVPSNLRTDSKQKATI